MSNVAHSQITFTGTMFDFAVAVRFREQNEEPLRIWNVTFERHDDGLTTASMECAWAGDVLLAYLLSRRLPANHVSISWLEAINAETANATFLAGRLTSMEQGDGFGFTAWNNQERIYRKTERVYDDPDEAPFGDYTMQIVSEEPCEQLDIEGMPGPNEPIPAVGRL